jgi:hypothetical protein
MFAVVFFAMPVGISALLEFRPPGGSRPASAKLWQDVVVLAAVGLPVEFNWVRGGFPHDGLNSLPKLLIDSALYAYLVVRRLEGVGYDFRPGEF